MALKKALRVIGQYLNAFYQKRDILDVGKEVLALTNIEHYDFCNDSNSISTYDDTQNMLSKLNSGSIALIIPQTAAI